MRVCAYVYRSGSREAGATCDGSLAVTRRVLGRLDAGLVVSRRLRRTPGSLCATEGSTARLEWVS